MDKHTSKRSPFLKERQVWMGLPWELNCGAVKLAIARYTSMIHGRSGTVEMLSRFDFSRKGPCWVGRRAPGFPETKAIRLQLPLQAFREFSHWRHFENCAWRKIIARNFIRFMRGCGRKSCSTPARQGHLQEIADNSFANWIPNKL